MLNTLLTGHLKCKIYFRFIIHLMCVMKHTDLCYFHLQSLDMTGLVSVWSRSRSFWSRSHNRFLVSVSISVSHSLVSVSVLVSLCSGLINKPGTWLRVKSKELRITSNLPQVFKRALNFQLHNISFKKSWPLNL